jgi:hypothetical protein
MTTAEAFVYILLLHSQDIISNEKNIMHAQTVEDIVTVVRFFDANNTGINSKRLYLIACKTLSIQIIYLTSLYLLNPSLTVPFLLYCATHVRYLHVIFQSTRQRHSMSGKS